MPPRQSSALISASSGPLRARDLNISSRLSSARTDGHDGPDRASHYQALEDQFQSLKAKYSASMEKLAESAQFGGSRAVEQLTAVNALNRELNRELTEAQDTIESLRVSLAEAELRESPRTSQGPSGRSRSDRPDGQSSLSPHPPLSRAGSRQTRPAAASTVAAAVTPKESTPPARPVIPPPYIPDEDYGHYIRASRSTQPGRTQSPPHNSPQPAPTSVAPPVGTDDLRERYDELQKAFGQREIHLRDLVHTLEDRDREIVMLKAAIAAAEQYHAARDDEVRAYLQECDEVQTHNSDVMREKVALLSRTRGENTDLRAELHVRTRELDDAKGRIATLEASLKTITAERDSFSTRLGVVKANAERLLIQRDGRIETLEEMLRTLKETQEITNEARAAELASLKEEADRQKQSATEALQSKEEELERLREDLHSLREELDRVTKERSIEAEEMSREISALKLASEKKPEEIRMSTRVITDTPTNATLPISEKENEEQLPTSSETGNARVREQGRQRASFSYGPRLVETNDLLVTDLTSRTRPRSAFNKPEGTQMLIPIEYLVVNK
ncbi:hypothetical protein GMRT_10924 [Giardia muris]|uniref:Uncharacterized protein n=1 Tax=Giardia muris TaxID=5742 RepID=A0A4Z1T0E5_GIAMU|nr:hypothetical protein GMRT_10924 [Giardia muris]|eukprot:TNJ30455.1 hypothetical protein GMRT_10924 [Giardia muris]